MESEKKPLLIYDGDCEYCQYSVDYWQKLTGPAVNYQPYQRVAADYPAISVEEFKRSVKYIMLEGQVASAAKASFLTLSHAPNGGIWLALYRWLPGFSFITEKAYSFISTHRSLAYSVCKFFWGKNPEPPTYDLLTWIFLRLFGVLFLVAFYSFATQALGLIGSRGIVPVAALANAAHTQLGALGFLQLPMLFWLNSSDFMIQLVSWSGVVISFLLIANIFPRICLFLLYILYLSLIFGGQVFMTFQWDLLLIETSLLAIILVRYRVLGVWLLRWLLFRFIFAAGIVKLASGDPAWWDFTALDYHFLTQPLPTSLAWYAYYLPPLVLKWLAGASLVIELGMPFLMFCPRRLRFWAGYSVLAMQIGITLTGNYNFFNFTTMLLCLSLYDDAALKACLPKRLLAWVTQRPLRRPAWRVTPYLVGLFTIVTILCSIGQFNQRFIGYKPLAFTQLTQTLAPFAVVSTYGPFAVMTKKRYEIVIEGSNDGFIWEEYAFKYKPGDLKRKPRWNIPFQPRLDWQMWFAALAPPEASPWFSRFLQRLLEQSPEVLALLERNPFPDIPPLYVRALFYDYTYTTAKEYKETGEWWKSKLVAVYFPAANLS